MPAVLVDVGHHFVEPDASGQTVTLAVVSNAANDKPIAGFQLSAQIVTAKKGPYFQSVGFSGDLWNTFPHIESGSPLPTDRTLASGEVAFTQGFETRADGTLVTFTIDTTGIPAGSYEFRLVGTPLGSSSFRRADGSGVAAVIASGTLQVRSIWQNPDNSKDVSGDGRISPLDVLLLLNSLSKNGSHELEMPSPGESPPPYLDVDGDGRVSPKDGLEVINCLNGFSCVTTPSPILANVTPEFKPKTPDTTNVSSPNSGTEKPQDSDPEEVPPTETGECEYVELDDDGITVVVYESDYCFGYVTESQTSDESNGDATIPMSAPASEQPLSSLSATAPSTFGAAIPSSLPTPSPKAVDSVIVSMADELTENVATNELIDLGLEDLFAAF